MKFTLKDGYNFDRGDVKGVNYTGNKFPRMSAAIFKLTGKHPKIKALYSDRLYFIIKGKGNFIIKDKKYTVKTKDVIIVPKNTPYSYQGTMECFLVHSPAFDKNQEIKY